MPLYLASRNSVRFHIDTKMIRLIGNVQVVAIQARIGQLGVRNDLSTCKISTNTPDSRRAEVIALFLSGVFPPSCPWLPPVQDKTEFQILVFRKRQTYHLSKSHFLETKPRNENSLAGLEIIDPRVTVTGERLPLVWMIRSNVIIEISSFATARDARKLLSSILLPI